MKITIEKLNDTNIALIDISKAIDALKDSTPARAHQLIDELSSLFQSIIKQNIIAPLCLLALKEDNEREIVNAIDTAEGLFDAVISRCNCIEDNTVLRHVRGTCKLTKKRIMDYLNANILEM